MNNWVLNPAYSNVKRKALELLESGVKAKTESKYGDYVNVNTVFERCRVYVTEEGKVKEVHSRSQIDKLFEIITGSSLN